VCGSHVILIPRRENNVRLVGPLCGRAGLGWVGTGRPGHSAGLEVVGEDHADYAWKIDA
jgi:hypothetical protein